MRSNLKTRFTDIESMLNTEWRNKISFVGFSHDEAPPVQAKGSIGVTDGVSPGQLLKVCLDSGLTQLVQRSSLAFDKEVNTSAEMLCDLQTFVDYPISAILDPGNCTQERENSLRDLSFSFNKTTDRAELLDQLEAYLNTKSRSGTFIEEVLLAADELFTNAIYNAPFMDPENSAPGASRSAPLVESERPAEIFAGTMDTRLVLGCRDNYGTLNLEKLFAHLLSCYEDGLDKNMNLYGDGGAKVGAFLIFKACIAYYAVVKPGQSTTICTTFPLKTSRVMRSQLPKNLHFG